MNGLSASIVVAVVAACSVNLGAAAADRRARAHELAGILNADVVIWGDYLRAWEVAVSRFRASADVPPAGKNLELYYIVFQQNANQYVIAFVPRVDEKGRGFEEKGARGAEITIKKHTFAIEAFTLTR